MKRNGNEDFLCDIGPYTKHSRQKLTEIAKKNEFLRKAQEITDERCDADLMYALLEKPQRELGQGVCLVDRILEAFINIVSKKNAPAYRKSTRIVTSNEFLASSAADNVIKQFNILFLIAREPSIQDVIRSGYMEDHPGNLWGTDCYAHFDQFVAHLQVMTETLLNWPYNELHIVENVRQFVYEAKRFYITT